MAGAVSASSRSSVSELSANVCFHFSHAFLQSARADLTLCASGSSPLYAPMRGNSTAQALLAASQPSEAARAMLRSISAVTSRLPA